MTPEAAAPGRPQVSIGALAWIAAAALFIGLRLAAMVNLPVSGPELVHLSGAWQARIGADDDRFVPTLFQSLSAFLLHGSTSEMPSRLLALLATATIPGALWLLRPRLGDLGALLALALLALDAPAIVLGSTASAMAFDYALAVWLTVAFLRTARLGWGWLAAGFLVATGGPLLLPLLAAFVVTLPRDWFALPRRAGAGRRAEAIALASTPGVLFAAGAAAGIAAASARFGLGWHGLVVPPFDLLAESFSGQWTTLTNGEALLLYVFSLALAGTAAWLVLAASATDLDLRRLLGRASFQPRPPTPAEPGPAAVGGRPLLLVWALFAAGWLVIALTANSTVALASFTLPLAFILGPALARALGAMAGASWRRARVLLPLAALAAAVGVYYLMKWATAERAGPGQDQFLAAVAGLIALACLVYLARGVEERATLTVAGLALGVPLLAAGALHLAFSEGPEPLASPYAPAQARELRDALFALPGGPGVIAVHPDLARGLTWPFRDSGDLVIASRVPESATVVLWPEAVAFPAEAKRFTGNWAVIRVVFPPASGVLRYLHWYLDRNRLTVTPAGVAVYTRTKQ